MMNTFSLCKILLVISFVSALFYAVFLASDARQYMYTERETLTEYRHNLQLEKEQVTESLADLKQQTESLIKEYKNVKEKEESLREDKEKENEELKKEKESLRKERESLQVERESLKKERERLGGSQSTPPTPAPTFNPRFEYEIALTEQVKPYMTKNRKILKTVPHWINETVYNNSIFHYGIPEHVYNIVDLDIGFEPTYSDVMAYIGNVHFTGPKTYLEIGVSVGKNMYQVLNAFEDSNLYAYELESINPTLASLLEYKSEVGHWPTMKDSPRKVDSYLRTFYLPASRSTLHYLASDVFDLNSWTQLANDVKRPGGSKFDIIFSDGFHSPGALVEEIDRILDLNLLDPDRFIIWYDDLWGMMTDTFFDISERVIKKFPHLNKQHNVALVKLGGWFGVNEDKHLNGIISTLDITTIIKNELWVPKSK